MIAAILQRMAFIILDLPIIKENKIAGSLCPSKDLIFLFYKTTIYFWYYLHKFPAR